jgi:hypothetical protein
MATKEEILNTFTSKEGAWFAYKEGIQVGYNEAFNSLRNQAAIAAMQGILSNSYAFKQYATNEEYKKIGDVTKVIALSSCMYADALIDKLKEK